MSDAMHVMRDYCPCCGTVFSKRDAKARSIAIDDAIKVLEARQNDFATDDTLDDGMAAQGAAICAGLVARLEALKEAK